MLCLPPCYAPWACDQKNFWHILWIPRTSSIVRKNNRFQKFNTGSMPPKNVAIPRCRPIKTVLDRKTPFKHWYISGYLFKCGKFLGAYLTWPKLLIVSSRKYFKQKIVAKLVQSTKTFNFRTATVIDRRGAGKFAPLKKFRCINILKVQNLGSQHTHQIWCQTVQNPWRHVHGITFVRTGLFGKIAKSLISVCTLQCARAPDRRLLVQPNPNKAVLKRLQQRLGLDQARFRVSARGKGVENS